MKKICRFLSLLILTIVLPACGSGKVDATPTIIVVPEEADTVVTEEAKPEGLIIDRPFQPPKLPGDVTKLVAASAVCASCHTGLENGKGINYSYDTNWRSSMMGHSAKDPYWLATMSGEISEHDQLEALIEDKCTICHMPLANFDAKTNEDPIEVFGEGFRDPANPMHDLAIDGVSCTLCHQIKADNLGEEESFSGGYMIDTEMSTRIAYGSRNVLPEMTNIMMNNSDYEPSYGEHVLDSALCATCHTLYTPYLDAQGEVAGYFPEQTVYQEWENSAYNGTQTCQECHMPKVTGNVAASLLSEPLPDFTRLHSFTGANAFMLRLLNANAQAVNLTATESQMQTAIERINEQLESNSAELAFGTLSVEDGVLSAEVTVRSLTGHKFPSGYPSRRAWLHLTVTDEAGNILFESGTVENNGLIVGNDNDADPTQYEPHYTQITNPDQVQIYEPIMVNTDGQVTTDLLLGATYAKDNRLLPEGFDIATASPDIFPYGTEDDSDFNAGGDIVLYQVDIGQASGPFTVSVELLYQSIGYRWIENLRAFGTPETDQFFAVYEAINNFPIVVAGVAQTITP